MPTIVKEPDEESAIENIPLIWDSPYTRRYLVCPMYVARRQEIVMSRILFEEVCQRQLPTIVKELDEESATEGVRLFDRIHL